MKKVFKLFDILTTMVGGKQNISTDSPPPKPTITVNGQEISYRIESFTWRNDGNIVSSESIKTTELVGELNTVHAMEEMFIDFVYEPIDVKVEVSKNDIVNLVELHNKKVKLPSKEGEFIYFIYASWLEGVTTYKVEIRIK